MGANNSSPALKDGEKLLQAAGHLDAAEFASHLPELRASIEGEVLLPTEHGEIYMQARSRPYNKDTRGFPLVIIRARCTEDVVKVVNFVRTYAKETPFCVICGGHSVKCMLSDSIVLDLVHMNEVNVDVDGLCATVGGGAYLEALDKALAPHGLATPVGTFPLTGVGGLVLAGGYGWLTRLHGFSVDNLLEVEVVLADGQVVIANDDNDHADLIKGLRGGGGNFGIVTKFFFRLYRLPSKVFGGLNVFLTPTLASQLATMLAFDALIQECPHNITGAMVFASGAPVVPTMWSYFGDAASPAEVPALVRASRLGGWAAIETSVIPVSYHFELQHLTQQHNPSGFIYVSAAVIGSAAEPLPPAFFEEMLTHTRRSPHGSLEKAVVILFSAGGAAVTPNEKTSLDAGVRGARYFVIIEAKWKPSRGEAGRQAAKEWAQGAGRVVVKYKAATMLHAPDALTAHAPSVDQSLGFEEATRRYLSELKEKYDGGNFFRQNANILPTSLLAREEAKEKRTTEEDIRAAINASYH